MSLLYIIQYNTYQISEKTLTMSPPKLLLLTAFVALTGCQSMPTPETSRGVYFNDIPMGSMLTLLQPVVIRAGQVRAQLPRTGPGATAGEYSPHCSLELWTRNEQAVTVEPDTFAITKVRGGLTPILVSRPEGTRVAGLGHFSLASWGQDDSSFLRSYAEMFVHSPRQPDVYRVNCGYMGDPWDVDPLTIAEIREALNGVFRLDLGL